MKKGFTMIELIFVIVILGILASIAIVRLAGTKADAEISTAAANLRTILSDASAYYTVKESFNGAKWNQITNVPLKLQKADGTATTTDGILTVGSQECIRVRLADRLTNGKTSIPARIYILKDSKNKIDGVCKQVVDADSLKLYFTSKVDGTPVVVDRGVIAIGSSESLHKSTVAAK